jgi:hypothetical protein
VIIEGHSDNSAAFNPAAAHMLSGGQAVIGRFKAGQ